MCGQGINVGPPSYEAAIVVIRVDSSMLARIRMPNQADCTGGCAWFQGFGEEEQKKMERVIW